MCPEALAVPANPPPGMCMIALTEPTIVSSALYTQAQRCWHWLVKVIYCNEICHMRAYGLIMGLFVNIFSKETNRQLKTAAGGAATA